MSMSDWTRITTKCPACKTSLKIRVDVDFDVDLDLECEGKEKQDALFSAKRDNDGNIVVPMVDGNSYVPMIPNVGVFPAHHPEGKCLIHGVERQIYLFGSMFLLDAIPFLAVMSTEFEEYAGRDWTEPLAKHFDFKQEWLNAYPSETNNAMTAMRTEHGELLCYAKRNDLDLFHAMCPKPTFIFPRGGSLICASGNGIMIGGTMRMDVSK